MSQPLNEVPIPADRQEDVEIATRVMGWTDLHCTKRDDDTLIVYGKSLADQAIYAAAAQQASGLAVWSKTILPDYTSDRNAAFEVIDAICDTDDNRFNRYKFSWACEYSPVVDYVFDFTPRGRHPKSRQYPAFQASGSSFASAVYRAAIMVCDSLDHLEEIGWGK